MLTAIYLVCFFVARKHPFAGLLIGLVWFSFDTLAMIWLFGFASDMVMDYALHALAIVELVLGVMGAAALKKLPPEDTPAPAPADSAAPATAADSFAPAESPAAASAISDESAEPVASTPVPNAGNTDAGSAGNAE